MGAREAKHDLRRLETRLEESGGHARLIVATEDPLAHDRLVHMGYLPIGDERFATRWFPRSANVGATTTALPPRSNGWSCRALDSCPCPGKKPCARSCVASRPLTCIGGSTAARRWPFAGFWSSLETLTATSAMPRGPSESFDDLLVTPVEQMNEWVATHTGRAFCHATIEWLSEPHAKYDTRSAPHEQGSFIADQIETVRWRQHVVPVPPLSAQLRVCESRRTDRPGQPDPVGYAPRVAGICRGVSAARGSRPARDRHRPASAGDHRRSCLGWRPAEAPASQQHGVRDHQRLSAVTTRGPRRGGQSPSSTACRSTSHGGLCPPMQPR